MLYVDRLSALLVVVSSIVLLAVLLFSVGQGAADGDDDTPVSIFHPSYLILGAGIFNAFIAGDLFNLYVGFEILLVASYVLITLGSTESRIRTGVVYIVVSLVSSILFLAAIAMIYGALGTVNMVQISERMGELPQETQLILHLMLLLAFSIKAAVFPLSFWLPDSYPTAPAPVTAVFAGLLTKVGVYAIIRTETELFLYNDVNQLLMWVALATMIVGVLGAVAQAELKRILSFTLVSHIGYMIFGLAIATPAAIGATIYYMIHHIVVQTTLFLAVGLVERRAGIDVDPAGEGAHEGGAGDRRALLHPRREPRRAAAVLGLHRQVRAVRRRRAGRHADHDRADGGRHPHEPADALRPHARVEPVVLARRGRLGRDRGAHLVPRLGAGGRRRDRAPRHPEDHDRGDHRHGRDHRRAHGLRRTALRRVHAHRRGAAAAGVAHAAAGRRAGYGEDAVSPDLPQNRLRRATLTVWRQLPFFVWLIALWMLLWGQFTWLAFLTGLIAAIIVTRIFRLPPVELSGRVNLWWGFVFVLEFLVAVVHGSLTVAWQVLDFRRQPGAAIIAVQLRTDDDLIMTHTGVTASLIPGSLIVDTDRDRRILYLHVIGVRDDADVEKQRASVHSWEARIVRAVGSRAQLRAIRADAAARRPSRNSGGSAR